MQNVKLKKSMSFLSDSINLHTRVARPACEEHSSRHSSHHSSRMSELTLLEKASSSSSSLVIIIIIVVVITIIIVVRRRCYSRIVSYSFPPLASDSSTTCLSLPLPSSFQTAAIFRGCSSCSQTALKPISCASAASLSTSMLLSTLSQLEQAARARAGPHQRLSGLQQHRQVSDIALEQALAARTGRDASATSSGPPGNVNR